MAYSFKKRSGMSYRRKTNGYKKTSSYKKKGKRINMNYIRNNVYPEKKYKDRGMTCVLNVHRTGMGDMGDVNSGIGFTSGKWFTHSFSEYNSMTETQGNLLRSLVIGNSVSGRVGNVIKVQYVKGNITFTAAMINSLDNTDQGGENITSDLKNPSGSSGLNYVRTTIRYIWLIDKQINNTTENIAWNDVMENNNDASGVHSELKVSEMARYQILEDKILQLDADDPQKTIKFYIDGSKIGTVRYTTNSGITGRTSKGLHLIIAAFTQGNANWIAESMCGVVMNTRLCFTDA